MTKITEVGSTPPIRRSGAMTSGGAGGFRIAAAIPSVTAPVASIAVAGLIALQEEKGPHAQDRASRRSGDRVLGALGRVQHALLAGSDAAARAALRDAVGDMVEPADPVLAGIIRAIRLRARVELARREGV